MLDMISFTKCKKAVKVMTCPLGMLLAVIKSTLNQCFKAFIIRAPRQYTFASDLSPYIFLQTIKIRFLTNHTSEDYV